MLTSGGQAEWLLVIGIGIILLAVLYIAPVVISAVRDTGETSRVVMFTALAVCVPPLIIMAWVIALSASRAYRAPVGTATWR